MFPSRHGYYSQPASFRGFIDPSFTVDHQSQFADRTTVKNGDRQHTYKAAERRTQYRTVYVIAWVRPIEYNHFFAIFSTSFHHIEQGTDISVESGSDILYVEQNNVDILQLVRLAFYCFRRVR